MSTNLKQVLEKYESTKRNQGAEVPTMSSWLILRNPFWAEWKQPEQRILKEIANTYIEGLQTQEAALKKELYYEY